MERKRINIKEKLPVYTAPVSLWGKIEEQLNILDNEQVNNNIKTKLPLYHAPDIFENISPPTKAKVISFYFTRVAASIILVIGLTFGFKQIRNKAHIEISHTIEQNSENLIVESIDIDFLNSEFKNILSQNCKIKPKVCNQSDYVELINQMKDIENETIKLQEILKQFKSADIENYLVRLTNDKLKIENYILKLFI